ncbi:phage portal protein [Pseudonocardia sp. N23]|uniref:phage portal protein n=1 Tax=Pseudonocardia sp. N23 TaxID=1987376 RepID=UPI000BFD663E|nr:phage portal protein [Pseudonocardia sp. N23]GAY12044.1 phage portal protein [Pseudonocardia sp. N23]
MADLDVLRGLIEKISNGATERRRLNAYYQGEKRLSALGITLPPQMQNLAVVVNWPRLAIRSLEERLDVEGFRLAGETRVSDRLWDWWQANNLDTRGPLGHKEAFVTGDAYVVVGRRDGDDETPLITVESGDHLHADVDPGTGEVRSAGRVYAADDNGVPQRAALYLPDVTLLYELRQGRGFVEVDAIEHDLGTVPVVPMLYQDRLSDESGHSEMADIIGLTDACCRSLTNLGGAQELLAVPQRYVLGASREDFVDEAGNPKPAWEAYIGRLWALGNEDAKVGQFSAADLRNFTEVINLYSKLVSAMTGMPPHYLGYSTDNPASADAIRSSESRLVKRAERAGTQLADAWEAAFRIALRWIDDTDDVPRLETRWRDPSTPTFAAKADAVTKLVQAGIIPKEAAWDALGYSVEQQAHYAQLMASDPLAALIRSVGADQAQQQAPAAPAAIEA